MKKITLIIMTLTLLIAAVACAKVKGNVTSTEMSNATANTVPMTGYPSGVQMPMLYLNGKLYVFGGYCHIGNVKADYCIEERHLILIGETKAEQNEEEPSEECVGARLPVGTKIYTDKDGRIYVLERDRILTLKLKEE